MLTPQEAEAHVFPKASFGGYNMLQVDTFLESLIEDYRTLYQENTSLKNKMKVLVDKVEEYRSTEDAMRRALHSAQKMAEEMIREGETQKQVAIEEAEEEARRRSEEIQAELALEEAAIQAQIQAAQTALANEETRLAAARASTTAYISKLKELYTAELQYIGNLSELTAGQVAVQEEEPAPASVIPEVTVTPEQEEEVAQDIEASMAKIFDTPGQDAATSLGDTRAFGDDMETE
ncbi:MAG: DivIVA domain-containing protein [Ruminiclostridium sp.]|nr:DivIVA domain-containing protein [Ruminiclostridium sp.]